MHLGIVLISIDMLLKEKYTPKEIIGYYRKFIATKQSERMKDVQIILSKIDSQKRALAINTTDPVKLEKHTFAIRELDKLKTSIIPLLFKEDDDFLKALDVALTYKL